MPSCGKTKRPAKKSWRAEKPSVPAGKKLSKFQKTLDKTENLLYNLLVRNEREEMKMEDKITVKELIEKLSQYDENAVVTLMGLDGAILFVGDHEIVMEI